MALETLVQSPWWIRSNVRGTPRVRLFCFPMAGSAASLFGGWAAALPEGVELYALQMPGRENRMRETPIRNLADAVEGIVAAYESLQLSDDLPTYFFGYSLGGLLTFETARALQRAGKRLPKRLLIAATPAPDSDRSRIPKIHHLPDPELITMLRSFQGTPDAILNNMELMSLLLPVVRADFELIEKYRFSPGPPLPIPIVAFGGVSDTDVRPDEVAEWSSQTSSEFSLQFMPGDHFFIKTAQDRLLEGIARQLNG